MKKLLTSFFFILCFCIFNFSQEKSPESGIGTSSRNTTEQPTQKREGITAGVKILAKPRADYTNEARDNGVSGVVRLRVTFLASGKIGGISPVTTLPFGLTEQSIEAARNLRFTPAVVNGQPVTVVKLVEYNFTIYYDENNEHIKEKAQILEMPQPDHPQEKVLRKFGGKVKVKIALQYDGSISVMGISTILPSEFEEKAREAAYKIKFNPAILKNGNKASQVEEIEYEFKPQN